MSFMNEKRITFLTYLLAIILLFLVASNFIKTDYMLTAPGAALQLEEIITVEKGSKDAEGGLYLTAVSSREASLFNFLYVKIFQPRGIELTPKELTLPPDISMEKYIEIMEDMMFESQMFAKVVALREVGYEPHITGHGAEIIEIMEESKAEEVLKPGDIIIEIGGEEIGLAAEAVQQIRKHDVGEKVDMTVKRDGEKKELEVETIELKDSPNKASVGIYIATYNREYSFPIEVDMATENIIGPSAGTMFALEIVNQLTEGDLTKGYKIAGTGTISLEGEVGVISGVDKKVMAAEAKGISYFLAPAENYDKAVEAATKLEVVKIKTFDDALNFLEGLNEK